MTSIPPDEWKRLRGEYGTLIERFGAAWTDGNAAVMLDLFTDDATFYPDPHAEAIRGRAAIQEYWGDTPYEQSEIAFRSGEVYVAGPWFATEFKCTFRRRRTGERVDVRGSLFCETVEGKISEMRMYWHRTVWRDER